MVIFVWKTGDFLDFAKVGPVEWKLGWAGRVVVGNCPGRFSVPVRPWKETRKEEQRERGTMRRRYAIPERSIGWYLEL